jgi:hypothetical protein
MKSFGFTTLKNPQQLFGGKSLKNKQSHHQVLQKYCPKNSFFI